jgi:tetratricopeptide (TPR) repeat protein
MKVRSRSRPARARKTPILQPTLQACLIILAIVLAYLPALRADFVWDDELLITKNPLLRDSSGLVEIWSGGRTADYFPLTNSIFWIEWHLFGDQATGFHAVNIVLQVANTLLVWLVLRRLHIPGAWLAGLIFGVHPVHVESVAWISELKNMLSMFFALVSVLCFLEIDEKRLLSTTAYAGSLVFFVLALLAKTQVVFLPVVLLLCAWWRAGQRSGNANQAHWQREANRLLPFFFIAFLLGFVTIWFQNRGLGHEEIVLGSLSRRVANAGLAIWWYAGKLALPFHLMPIYPRWRFDTPSWYEWLPLIALVAVLGALWRWRERGTRAACIASLCFVAALLPVLGFLQISYVRSGTLVADHYQYFADVSLIALFTAGIARLWEWPRAGIRPATLIIASSLIGVMGIYTWSRADIYRNEETLWQDNLSKNPDAWQAHNRLGERLFQQDRFAEAAEHFERAAQLKPDLADNYNELGLAYCRLERFEEGIAQYREGLRMQEAKPSRAKTASVAKIEANLGNALAITANSLSERSETEEATRRYDEAIREYEKSLELDPRQPAIHRNLGVLLARLGRYNEAVPHLRATLQLVPNEPLAREVLDALEGQGR